MTRMIVLPLALAIAVICLLAVFRQERHRREEGIRPPNPRMPFYRLAAVAIVGYLVYGLAGTAIRAIVGPTR